MQFRPKQTVNAILANLLSMKTGWKQPLRKREIKMSRIQQTFAALDGAKALIPYITVGDPNLDTTLALMHSLVENGAQHPGIGRSLFRPDGGRSDHPARRRACVGKQSFPQRRIEHRMPLPRNKRQHAPSVLMGLSEPDS